MMSIRGRPGRFAGGALLLTGVLAGCGGAGAAELIECTDLELGTRSAQPLDSVRITGLPVALDDTLVAEVRADTAVRYTLATRGDEDSGLLLAPLHPHGGTEGGEVEIGLRDSAFACEAVPFTIEPLDAATGTVRRTAGQLQDLLDGRAAAYGITAGELRSTTPDELPPGLLPLLAVQFMIDHVDNPNSIRALIDGTAPRLDGTEVDLSVSDALWARAGVDAHLAARADTLGALGPMPGSDAPERQAVHGPPTGGPREASTTRTSGFVRLASSAPARAPAPPSRAADPGASRMSELLRDGNPNAAELDWMMDRAFHAEIATTGKAADIYSLLELTLGAGAAIPGATRTGFEVATAIAVANRLLNEFEAALFPSTFDTITVDLDPATFEEDNAGPGEWGAIEVTARSRGLPLDQNAVGLLTGGITKGVLSKAGLQGKHFSNEQTFEMGSAALETAIGYIQGEIVGETVGDSDFLEIPGRTYGPTDISERQWREVRIAGSAVSARQDNQYVPVEVGTATFRVETRWDRFGIGDGQHIVLERPIRVDPIDVRVDPPARFVEPGETVTLQAEVRDALDPSVMWTVESGGGEVVSAEQIGSNLYSAQVEVPDPLDEAVVVRATSVADRGHLRSAPDRSGTATLRPRRLAIQPSSPCVRFGETVDFSVRELDDDEVRWATNGGSIREDGRFTAPGAPATVTIAAVSREDGGLRDEIEVEIDEACASACTFEGSKNYPDGGYPSRGKAEINDVHGTLSLFDENGKHFFTVDISPLEIGGQTGRITTRGKDLPGSGGWDRFTVDLHIEENADPAGVAEWEEMETVGESLESIGETGLGLADRLAMRRLRGQISARWSAASGSGPSSVRATFDAGNGPYQCEGGLEVQKEAVERLREQMGDDGPDQDDSDKLEGLMGEIP